MRIAQTAADGSQAAQSPIPLGLRCPCGIEICGAGAEALVSAVDAHLVSLHPRLVGNYGRDDILSLSYRKPAGKDPR
jgi:hypothetical protein